MARALTTADGAVGKYRIIADMGSGGMSEVFLAIARNAEDRAALQVVKRIKKEQIEEPEMVAMFLDEARIAVRLDHPNVVRATEVGEVDGRPFIAMEYVEGQSLHRVCHEHERRHRSPIPRDIYLRAIADFLPGLSYLHTLRDEQQGPLHLVHRDISPANILVGYDGRPRILDFGVAKAATNASATRKGLFKGKIGYGAPEQMRGDAVGPATDIYAVGVMLWEAVAGRTMWKDEPDLLIAQRVIGGDLPRLASAAPDAPASIVRIVERATAFAPEGRYASVDELSADLEACLAADYGGVTTDAVSDFLNKLFFSLRERSRATIESRLDQFVADPSARLSLVDLYPEPLASRTAASKISVVMPPPTPPASSTAPGAVPVPAPEPVMSKWIPIGLIAATVAGGVLVATLMRPTPRAEPRRPAVAVSPLLDAPVAPTPPAALPPPSTATPSPPPSAPSATPAAPSATPSAPSAMPSAPSAMPAAPSPTALPAPRPGWIPPAPVAAPAPSPSAAPAAPAPPPPTPAKPAPTWDKDSPLLPP